MKVFVSDRYPPVQERLIGMVASIAGVEIVGEDDNSMDISQAVERLEPDVVVMGARPAIMAQLAKLRHMKTKNKSPIVILLADEPSFSSARLLSAGADFVFDRSYEFDQLLKLIEEMSGRRP